ncbi:helix-turn-helix domain-containing protein [Mesorhizobium sp. Root157]|uniref:helix-turn-helix domain-containing protein n=1 Tax=Mesorhizobium sp. Root157 TaxID=1736477 RepID=UPI000AB2EAEA|nr:helix-turn-helix domain-containing protein [Mesorhizobium sp. Root157]
MARSKLKRKGGSKFIKIDSYVKRSAAWKALTPTERAAYLEVKWRYDGFNNGRIGVGCRELADELNKGRDTASRALKGLEEKGFIVEMKASAFNVKNRAATEWRLTEYPCNVTNQLASKDFMRVHLKEKPQSDPSDTQSDPSDAAPRKPIGKTPHSRMDRTVTPEIKKPQSHPSDTYRSTMGGRTNVA